MKMREINAVEQAAITEAFMREMVSRYDCHELRPSAENITSKSTTQNVIWSMSAEVAPRGQLAAIVKQLTVKLEVRFCRENDQNYVTGVVHYRYAHHDGGGNGDSQDFVIVLNERFGGMSYEGCLNSRLAHSYFNQRAQ